MPVLGIIDQPITRERWLGVAGEQTTLNGVQIAMQAAACGCWQEGQSRACLVRRQAHQHKAVRRLQRGIPLCNIAAHVQRRDRGGVQQGAG